VVLAGEAGFKFGGRRDLLAHTHLLAFYSILAHSIHSLSCYLPLLSTDIEVGGELVDREMDKRIGGHLC
jgi:hypothetical protein